MRTAEEILASAEDGFPQCSGFVPDKSSVLIALAAIRQAQAEAIEEAVKVFDEHLNAQSTRLGIHPTGMDTPIGWASRVRQTAIRAVLSAEKVND